MCNYCEHISPSLHFEHFAQYEAAKKVLNNLVDQHFFEISSTTEWETTYRCKQCTTKWVLADPDFPFRGYLIRQ